MKPISLATTAGQLLGYIVHANVRYQAMMPERLSRKRHPVRDSDTGPEASTNYLSQKSISRSLGSSLRKIDRAHRIFNGAAIRKHGVPTKREMIAKRRAEFESWQRRFA